MSEMNDFNQQVIKEFRENDGNVGGPFEGADLLLLHTSGAKSGRERINPLVYLPDGDRLVIIASKAGAPSNPDWYYNLKANPAVEVEVGTERFSTTATETQEPERTELYEKVVAKYPNFDEYRQKTTRTIPVITLTRQ